MTDEVWDSIAEAFENDPAAAFILAQVLSQLKELIKKNRKAQVIEAIDTGIDTLFPFTDDYRASLKLYHLSVAGRLKPKHDPTIIVKDL